LGWVSRVYREGSKLLADFIDMPKVVYDAIKKGLYKFVSVELLRNVQVDTRVVPLILDAVALLGADPPAVGILKDLQALTMRKLHGFHGEASLAFTREFTNIGGREAMADENDDLKKLREDFARLQAERDAEKARNAELKAAAVEAESYKRRLEELTQATHAEKVEKHRKVVKEMFEKAVNNKEITPAARERFYKHFDVEADDVLKLTVKDVEEYIKENPNPYSRKGPATGAGGDEIVAGGWPDQEALSRARKYCRDNSLDPTKWENLVKGGMHVFSADRELGLRYKMMPSDYAAGNLSN
jgi:hypothetical protein